MDIGKCPLLVKADTQNTSRSEFYNSLSYTRTLYGARQSVRSALDEREPGHCGLD